MDIVIYEYLLIEAMNIKALEIIKCEAKCKPLLFLLSDFLIF